MKCTKIIINGNIYTVEGSEWDKNAASAMAIACDGSILAVGSDEEILKLKEADTEIVDLGGKTVLPGLVDGHVHAPGTSFTDLYDINLFVVKTYEDTMATIKKFVEEHPDQERYFGGGYNFGIVNEKGEMPCAKWLDEICPDKEMLIRSYDMHSKWLNSVAMKNYGIDKNTTTSGIGNIHRDKDGNPTGLFTDVDDLTYPEPVYTHDETLAATKDFVEKMNKWGYTSVMSIAPLWNISYDYYKELEAKDELTLRVNGSVLMDSKNPKASVKELNELKEKLDSRLFKMTTAKYMIDGVVEGCTAYLLEPYKEEAGKGKDYVSKPDWEFDTLVSSFDDAIANGYQLHCHSIGDAASKFTLDAIEKVQAKYADKEHRNAMTHLQLITKEDIERCGRLNIIPALQTFWHLKEPLFYENVESVVLGDERASKQYPAKSFVNVGCKITNSGDFPVSSINNPFWGIQAGVTRDVYNEEYFETKLNGEDDNRFKLDQSECLSIKDMIEAYTINGAYELFREDEVGSLKAGKKADFIVITEDPFKINVRKINEIEVLATYFEGNKVFEA